MNTQQPPPAIPCHEPATRRPLGEVPVDDARAVQAAVDAARAAQQAWAGASFAQRRRVLARVRDHLLRHADELVEVVCRDAGKTREHAILGELWPVLEKLRWTMAHGERHLRPERRSAGLLVHKAARVEFPPRGVIGVICPWNYPLQNVLGPAIAALFAGNGVVAKVSEQVAWSGARIQRIFDEALTAEGFSPHLVRLVHGYADTGRALILSGVDAVVFTGSRANGQRVMATAAEALVPVVLELGGDDPMIVCDDAHLERAVAAALGGAFIHNGQNCLAVQRVLLLPRVADAFERRIVEEVGRLRVGDPLGQATVDVGAIVSPHQVDVIERLVGEAVDQGARLLTGGRRLHAERGQFFVPTVLADVTPDMAIAQEEAFGPLLLLMRVRDEDHAVEVANGTPFGLSSSIFTRSRARARRLGRRLVAGSTLQNDFGVNYLAQALPFGGTKGSGFGRLNGREGLRAMCHEKTVLEDRLPWTPPQRVFPVGPQDAARLLGAVEAIYGGTARARLRGVVRLVRGR